MKDHLFGILGYGYVGQATHFSLIKNFPTKIYDTNKDDYKDNLSVCNTVFICTPTQTQQDVKILINDVINLYSCNPNIQFIIRSTLPVGTCKLLKKQIKNIIYMPEFFRERYWESDCLKRPLIVGYDGKTLPTWISKEKIIVCTTDEAEIIKMFANNFAVLKIAFANIFYDLTQATNTDYDKIKNAFLEISHDQNYIEMPGHDGQRGFGGKCLPKDLNFLTKTLKQHKIDNKLFSIIKKYNDIWRDKSE